MHPSYKPELGGSAAHCSPQHSRCLRLHLADALPYASNGFELHRYKLDISVQFASWSYVRVSLFRCPSMPCYGPTKLSTPGSVRLVSKLGTGPVRSRYASVELCSTLTSTYGLACVCLRLDQNLQCQCLDAMRSMCSNDFKMRPSNVPMYPVYPMCPTYPMYPMYPT